MERVKAAGGKEIKRRRISKRKGEMVIRRTKADERGRTCLFNEQKSEVMSAYISFVSYHFSSSFTCEKSRK